MPFLLSFLFIFASHLFLLVSPVKAQCPVCVVTVGGGMLLAKKLGIDDFLVSIWISALNAALSFWLAPKIKLPLLRNPILLSLVTLGLTLLYFGYTDQIGVASNSLLGIDKIVFGQVVGFLAMVFGNLLYLYTKKRNQDRALFPYSKVAFPVSTLLLLTIIFKFAFNL